MNSNTVRALVGAGIVVVAVVLLIVLKSDNSDSSATTTKGVTTIVVKNGEPVGGIAQLTYNKGEEVRFKVDSDVSDEVHMHGYDIMKDVKAGGSVSFDFPATIEGVFEAELEGRKEQILELTRESVSWLGSLLPVAHALVARKDLPVPAWLFAWAASIVLIVSFFALSVGWRTPRFEKDRWRPLAAGLSRALLAPPAQIFYGAVGVFLLARGDLRRPARDRSTRPQLRPHLPLRHHLARLPAVQRLPRRRLPSLQPLAGGRAGRGRRIHGAGRPAAGPPEIPAETGALAGRDRFARGRLAGDRLRGRGWRGGGAGSSRRGRRRPRLHRLHAGDDGAVRGRAVVPHGGGLLGLLRHVRQARLLRGEGRAAGCAPTVLRRNQVGDRARVGRRGDRLDRDAPASTAPRRGRSRAPSKAPSTTWSTPASA